MRAYIIRRLLLIIPTLLIAGGIIFFAIRLIPGNVIDLMLAQRGGTSVISEAEERAIIEKRLGLDVPIHVQFGRWLNGIILHGDLGTCLWKGTPVTREILPRIPITLELGLFGLLIALVISFPIGVYSAIRQDSAGDYAGRSFAIACIALPDFWLGTLVVVFPSIWFNWSPSVLYIPFTEDPVGILQHFIILGAILGMSLSGVTMRMIRTMMLEVLRQDYIRTAWSKGLKENVVILRHALKNALIPVVTIFGLQMPVLISGTVILEQIFALPGMGRLLIESALLRDYTVVSGVILFIAVAVLFINLIIDLIYGFLDPRIHYA